VTLAGYERILGSPLAPGTIVIPLAERDELASVLGSPAPPNESTLHPLHAYIAMQRGINSSIEDLCAFADFPMEDGPLMGTMDLQIHIPLEADTEYRVEGEVVDLVRKEGKRMTFDLFSYRERLVDSVGRIVATATNSFVLPRKDLA
jgi:hypothetical protein